MKYLEGTHSPSPWSGRLGGGGGGGLAGWLVGWLAGWSGWLVGWLAGWVRIIGFDYSTYLHTPRYVDCTNLYIDI